MTIEKMQFELVASIDAAPGFTEREVEKVRSMPPIMKLLQFIGYTGMATGVQLYRFLRRDYAENKSLELIAYAIKKRYITPFKIPKQPAKCPVLFYFAERGFKYLRGISRDIAMASRWGVPDKKRMNQAPHDLIIMGSLIKWREDHEILWFISDKQMRQEKMRERWRYWRYNIGSELPSEAIGDYKICVYKMSDGDVKIHECESSIKYKVEVIESKPPFMKWFTSNRYQQKKIYLTTGQMPELIDPFAVDDADERHADEYIRTAITANKYKNNADGMSLLDRQIIGFMSSTQMVVSTDDLMQMLPDAYRNIARSLVKLEKKGLLKSDVGKLLNGTGRGRPQKYYYLKENDSILADPNSFQRHIILSFIFCRGNRQRGWRLLEFDKRAPTMTVEIKGVPFTFMSDHNLGESRKVTLRTVNEFFKLKDKFPHKVVLVIVDYDRKCFIECDVPAENIYDLSGHFLKIKANR